MNNQKKLLTALSIGLTAALAITFAIPFGQQTAEARSAPPGHPDCQHLPGGCNNEYIMGDSQYTELRSGRNSYASHFGHHEHCHFC